MVFLLLRSLLSVITGNKTTCILNWVRRIWIRDLEQGKQTLRMDKVNDVLALFGEYLGPVKTDIV